MAPIPPSLRVNLYLPFPSLVTGSGPVTVTKVNGVWTLGFSPGNLAPAVPPPSNYATDYLIGYDSVAGNMFLLALANLPGATKVQRSVTSSGSLPIGLGDQIINVKITSGGFVLPIPLANPRAGSPLTIKNVSGGSAITMTATAPDLFDGVSSLVVGGGSVVTLMPYNDGVNSGYGVV